MHDGEVNSLAAVPLAASEANAVHEIDSSDVCSIVPPLWTPPVLSPEQSDVVLSVKPKSPCVSPSVSDLENVHDSEVTLDEGIFCGRFQGQHDSRN